MAENDKQDVEDNESLDIVETDDTDWKAEAEKLREKAIRQRERTRLLREENRKLQAIKPDAKAEVPITNKTELDDTDQLFLDTRNVPEEDREWYFKEMKETGKNARTLYGLRYIQEELKNRAQNRASEQALPGGNNRSGSGSGTQTPEYWLARIESGQTNLMAVPSRELRSKIVELRKSREGQGKRFTDHPVV